MHLPLHYKTKRKSKQYIQLMKKVIVYCASRILGPLMFNILLYDIFCFVAAIEIASYSDDNKPFKGSHSLAFESPLKMMKNGFHFTLKVLFVLKIFDLL